MPMMNCIIMSGMRVAALCDRNLYGCNSVHYNTGLGVP